MSRRRRVGEIVRKKANAGFVGEELVIRLVDFTPSEQYSRGCPCFLCDDPKCFEWANVEVLEDGKVIGYCCHVLECEMEDL